MNDVDPNWLLATLAQSAAAIVAIVGGFLVSRIVSMSAERTAIRKRYDEVNDELTLTLDQLQDVYSIRHAVSVEWFRDQHLKTAVESDGRVSPEELLTSWLPLGADEREMRHAAQELVSDVLKAIEDLARLAEEGWSLNSVEHARAAGLDIPDELEDIYSAVIVRNRPSTRDPLGFAIMPEPFSPRTDEIARQEDRIRDEVRLERDVDHLRAQWERLGMQQKEKELPGTLYGGVGILAYLTAVGVIFPAAMMASRPVPQSLGWRWTALLLFVSGILALLVYLWLAIRALQR